MPLDTVDGFVRDRFAAVRNAFEANLASGADVGASFCATVEGETVVDLWGGFADGARTRPWEKDTIVNVYSTTKTMTALARSCSPTAASWISTRRWRGIGRSSSRMAKPASRSAT